jgi:DNA-binding response OmpR family regulator
MGDPTLLVIEDARDHALLVRVAARRAAPGLDVRVAGDGREGIAYLEGTPPFQDRRSHPLPDLIILDLLMPDLDGFAVLEWLREHQFNNMPVVVLTSSDNPELLMPDLDGFAVLEWLREHQFNNMPVVVLTSSDNPEHEQRSMELGADAFFRKPESLDALDDVVRQIVVEWVDSAGPSVSASVRSAG